MSFRSIEHQTPFMAEKRTKMLTLWVTEDEHRRLLERCDGKQLAAWMRQTCLDERPARSGKLPTLAVQRHEIAVQAERLRVEQVQQQRQKELELVKERHYPGPTL